MVCFGMVPALLSGQLTLGGWLLPFRAGVDESTFVEHQAEVLTAFSKLLGGEADAVFVKEIAPVPASGAAAAAAAAAKAGSFGQRRRTSRLLLGKAPSRHATGGASAFVQYEAPSYPVEAATAGSGQVSQQSLDTGADNLQVGWVVDTYGGPPHGGPALSYPCSRFQEAAGSPLPALQVVLVATTADPIGLYNSASSLLR